MVILFTLAALLVAAPQSNAAQGCGDIQVVGLAGSGELRSKKTTGTDFLGQTNTDFYDKLVASYHGTGTRVTEHGVPYLDQSVRYFEIYGTYSQSKQNGVDNTLAYLGSVCTNTKLVLVGYSQGADIMMEVYARLNQSQKDRVVSVILFADPNFNPQSHPLDQGTYTQRPSGHGIWGARAVPTSPPGFQAKARSYCLVNDPICNSVVNAASALSCAEGILRIVTCAGVLRELQHGLVGCDPFEVFGSDSLSCPHLAYRETGETLLAALFVKSLFPAKRVLDHLVISPSQSTIVAGASQGYSVSGADTSNLSLGDVTAATVFSIAPDGTCTASRCTAAKSGVHTVTGTYAGKRVAAALNVQPSVPAGFGGIQSIATYDNYAVFAVKIDGTAWSWGANTYGELGNGTTTNTYVPVAVSGLAGVQTIAPASQSVIALKTDGTVWAWGYNFAGQLGNGTTTNSAVPVRVASLSGVKSITSAGYTAYAVKNDGSVWAWGLNSQGELGIGTTTNISVPVLIAGLSGVQSITSDGKTTLALKSDGTVWAWGNNVFGQLGNGTTTNSPVPVQVAGLSGVQSIASNGSTSLALKLDGTVRAWGYNFSGQLGNGTTTNSSVPVQVTGLSAVSAIATAPAEDAAVYTVKTDGTVWAWGANSYGELGIGSTNASTTPVQVSTLSGIRSVTTANNAVAVVKSDGTVWAWGHNAYGQLGIGTTSNSTSPAQVTGLSGVKATTSSFSSTYGLKNDGTVRAWGSNTNGLLGNGTTTDSTTAVPVG
ncbi:RCC1 domain-containing protein [Arthrobacter sp. 2MCAF14]|uniref:RCC1 domain-containing protein n=1 Tax=Arthrobacter sp. 2MCAF14 TaxID=3232982 RepID=UPI003F90CE40